jgi:hypothetical protein
LFNLLLRYYYFTCGLLNGQAVEWALLWIHFLWSGSGIIVFSVLSWKDIGVVRPSHMFLHFSVVPI